MKMIETNSVRGPFEYLKKLPGKSLRSKLIETFNEWIGADEVSMNEISEIIETLHTASLLIDDIEDNATERRGFECAHKKFGIPLTINSANLAYFEALKLLQSLPKNSTKITSIFADEMINLHVGQGLEIFYRDNQVRPTMEEYLKICEMKTGGLFRMSMRLLFESTDKIFNEQTVKMFIYIAEELGKLYQVRNDFLNLFVEDASDLIEGKFTLPTIFAEIDRVKCENDLEKAKVISKLKSVKAYEYCLDVLSQLADNLSKSINVLEVKTGMKNQLNEIIYSLTIKK